MAQMEELAEETWQIIQDMREANGWSIHLRRENRGSLKYQTCQSKEWNEYERNTSGMKAKSLLLTSFQSLPPTVSQWASD